MKTLKPSISDIRFRMLVPLMAGLLAQPLTGLAQTIDFDFQLQVNLTPPRVDAPSPYNVIGLSGDSGLQSFSGLTDTLGSGAYTVSLETDGGMAGTSGSGPDDGSFDSAAYGDGFRTNNEADGQMTITFGGLDNGLLYDLKLFTDSNLSFTGSVDYSVGAVSEIAVDSTTPNTFTLGTLVSQIDFYPTVCDLLGLEHPDWLQGKSLLPLLRGETDSLHEEVFSEVTFHAAFEPKRSVRTERWNYIRNFAAPHPVVLPNCDDGLSKRLLMERGLAGRIVPTEELYDLTFDPQERVNLATNPDCAEVLSGLRTRLSDWMRRTNDPILSPDPSVMPLPQKTNPWSHSQPDKTATDWDPREWDRIQHSV